MIYTDEVRKKLDAILKAFGEYIDGQNYFDIVYSKKIGYVWILAECPGDAGAVLLDTPEKMLDQLFNEVINANQGLKAREGGRKTAQKSRECKYVANKSHNTLLRCLRQ